MYNNYGPGALLESETRLYDLATDPGPGEAAATIAAVERRLSGLMARLMSANEAPPEAFRRLELASAAPPDRGVRQPETRCAAGRRPSPVRERPPHRARRRRRARRARARLFDRRRARLLGAHRPLARYRPAVVARPAGRLAEHRPVFGSPALHDAEAEAAAASTAPSRAFSSPAGSITSASRSTAIRCTAACRSRRRGVTAYGEDWERDEPVLFCEGEVVAERSSAASMLRLRRRIEAPIGGREIRIVDRVENLGCRPD